MTTPAPDRRSLRSWRPRALAAALFAATAAAQPPPSAPPPAIEEMTVVGRYPGPPLWKVTSGERALYIFGELAPVPKGLDWDPRNAERVLARADAVIAAPRIDTSTYNPFRLLRIARDVRRLTRVPRGTTLEDALPPELRARYAALVARYEPDVDEDARPAVAALRLYEAALESVDLTRDTNIGRTLERLMRRARAATAEPEVEARPETIIAELRTISREAELACFASTLTSIESDLAAMRERANAWAVGNVSALRRFDYPDSQGDCLTMLFTADGLAELRDDLYAVWLAEAERALATHATTFSVLPMRELVAGDGLLAQLAARGYTVTPP